MSALVATQAESWLAAYCTRALEVPLEPRLVASIRVAWRQFVEIELVDLRLAYPVECCDDGVVVRLTIAREVSQVESRCGNLSHDGRLQPRVARSQFLESLVWCWPSSREHPGPLEVRTNPQRVRHQSRAPVRSQAHSFRNVVYAGRADGGAGLTMMIVYALCRTRRH